MLWQRGKRCGIFVELCDENTEGILCFDLCRFYECDIDKYSSSSVIPETVVSSFLKKK